MDTSSILLGLSYYWGAVEVLPGLGTPSDSGGPSSMSHGPRRHGRRLATALSTAALGLAALIAATVVAAGTPVTVGYRDHAYGGGATRPAGDKPQSKLWYTDGQWYAGMFFWRTGSSPRSQNDIFRLTTDKTGWTNTNVRVDARDTSHADYYWDEPTQRLYVASVSQPNRTSPLTAAQDGVWIFRYTYDAATNTYSCLGGNCTTSTNLGQPVVIPGTTTDVGTSFRGGAWTVTIDRDSTGRLWAVWPRGTQVMYSTSTDGGGTWSTAAQLPAQGSNTIRENGVTDSDIAAVIAFGSGAQDTVGVMWSDHDALPASANNGYYFATIAAGADPAVLANWTTQKLPVPGNGTNTATYADNHINMKDTSDGRVFMVGKSNTDTPGCATLKQRLLIPFYDRSATGTWTARLAGTAGDCNTRPQMVVSEQLETIYLFLTSPNGGGTVYQKSAPYTGSEAFEFRGAPDQTVQRGIPFIKSATETLIDDPTTTKQVVTSASGIVVNANNLTSSSGGNAKVFLHNFQEIPSSDNSGPSGTVSINGGAEATTSATVTLAVPATDNGSGMSLVEVSNNSDMSGSTTMVYTPSMSWTLAGGGDGPRTVYVRWRDAAGTWSSVESDTINLNTTDPTPPTTPGVPTHAFFGQGALGIPIRVTWTASQEDESQIAKYELYWSVNGALFSKVAEPTTNSHSLVLSTSSKTYRFAVRAVNDLGVPSAIRYGPTFRAISYSEAASAVNFSSGWGTTSSSDFVGGAAKYSVRTNASASLTFVGNKVAWLSQLGPTMGSARVYIDGRLVRTVNLNSATKVVRKLVFLQNFSSSGTHTIRIVVAGTSGNPRVYVDQIFVLR